MANADGVANLVQGDRAKVEIPGTDITHAYHIGFSAIEADRGLNDCPTDKTVKRLSQGTGRAVNGIEAKAYIYVRGISDLGKFNIGDRLPSAEGILGRGQKCSVDRALEIERLSGEIPGRGTPCYRSTEGAEGRTAPFDRIGREIKRTGANGIGLLGMMQTSAYGTSSSARVVQNVICLSHASEISRAPRPSPRATSRCHRTHSTLK